MYILLNLCMTRVFFSVTRCPRYALQADSFYNVQNSRGNIFEFNVLSDTNTLTTDTGAIEMLGSGNPNLIDWWTNNTIRFNNISNTVSRSDVRRECSIPRCEI